MAGGLVVVLVTSAIQYLTFRHHVLSRDEDMLRDRVMDVGRILTQRPWDSLALVEEMDWEGPTGLEPQVWVRVSDRQGLLGETPGMDRLISPAWFDGRKTMASGGRTFALLGHFDGKHRIEGAMDITEDEQMVAGFLQQMMFTLTGGAVLAALVGWWGAYRGLQPIRDLVEATGRITAYSLQERLKAGRVPRELQHLVKALNAMLDRIDHAFQRLTQFSSDLAHEFRTPIAILTGEAETMLAKDRTPEEYRQALVSSLEELGRLSRLTSRMLFLARTENPQSAIPMAPVPMPALVREDLAFFEAAAEEKGVALVSEVRGRIQGDPDMLRQALGNLVSNALEASASGGSIRLAGGPQGERWVLTVADSGCGIAPEALTHVLDRFYRTGQFNRPGRWGTGLGLAIVQSITRLHGGEVSLESEVGRGTTVTLRFPALPEPEPAVNDPAHPALV